MKTLHAIAMIKRWLLLVIGLRDRVSNRLLIAALQPILAFADPRWDVSLIILLPAFSRIASKRENVLDKPT